MSIAVWRLAGSEAVNRPAGDNGGECRTLLYGEAIYRFPSRLDGVVREMVRFRRMKQKEHVVKVLRMWTHYE